jgi:hypothetical protein
MRIRAKLQKHPQPSNLDRDLVLRCIDECLDCADLLATFG